MQVVWAVRETDTTDTDTDEAEQIKYIWLPNPRNQFCHGSVAACVGARRENTISEYGAT
jgi:hypothetical protein